MRTQEGRWPLGEEGGKPPEYQRTSLHTMYTKKRTITNLRRSMVLPGDISTCPRDVVWHSSIIKGNATELKTKNKTESKSHTATYLP